MKKNASRTETISSAPPSPFQKNIKVKAGLIAGISWKKRWEFLLDLTINFTETIAQLSLTHLREPSSMAFILKDISSIAVG